MVHGSEPAPRPARSRPGESRVRSPVTPPGAQSARIGLPGWRLRGRGDECERLDRLLQRIRAGTSAVLVLRGEAGIGKTALLEYVAERATECRLARARRRAVGDGARVRRPASPVRAAARRARRAAGPAAGGAAGGVRPAGRRAAQPLPGRGRDPGPAGRDGRDAPAGVPDRRRAVARSRLRAGRSPSSPAACSPSRSRWSSPSASPPTGDELAGLPELPVDGLTDARRSRAAGRRRARATGRAGARPDRRRDARQPARAAASCRGG